MIVKRGAVNHCRFRYILYRNIFKFLLSGKINEGFHNHFAGANDADIGFAWRHFIPPDFKSVYPKVVQAKCNDNNRCCFYYY